MVTLGSTGIKVPQNGFGALPLQRVSMAEAEVILKKAYEGLFLILRAPTATVRKNSEKL